MMTLRRVQFCDLPPKLINACKRAEGIRNLFVNCQDLPLNISQKTRGKNYQTLTKPTRPNGESAPPQSFQDETA
jgi:hypothetical protein